MNYADHQSQCYVALPWQDLAGRSWRLPGQPGRCGLRTRGRRSVAGGGCTSTCRRGATTRSRCASPGSQASAIPAREPADEAAVVARFVGSGLRSADLKSPSAPTRSAPASPAPAGDRAGRRTLGDARASEHASSADGRMRQPGAAGADLPGGSLSDADWFTRDPPAEATGSALSSASERGRPQRPAASDGPADRRRQPGSGCAALCRNRGLRSMGFVAYVRR